MSKGGAATALNVTGWVFVERYRHDGFTVRWRRGDAVAYVLSGKKLGDHGMADVLGTIPVLPGGWTELGEVRKLGMRWMRGQ